MPLEPGKSRAAFRHNVREMIASGHPQKQAVAAAYEEQRRSDDERIDEILASCYAHDCVRADEHIGWTAMVEKLEREGHSKQSAERIAGYIKKRKYG